MINLARGQAWKIGTYVMGAGAAVLLFLLAVAKMEVRHVTKQRDNYERIINDPRVGLRTMLVQSQTNVATLTGALDQQSKAVIEQAERDKAALARSSEDLRRAQAASAAAQARAAAMATYQPQGGSVCERVLEVDAKFTEMLK